MIRTFWKNLHLFEPKYAFNEVMKSLFGIT